MEATYAALARDLITRQAVKGGQLMVCIAGAPGSGKTTTSLRLQQLIPGSVVVPMDGYHYYRRELDEFADKAEAYARRGAPFTFNARRFVADMRALRRDGRGSFPSFDHKIGDPSENAIEVLESHCIVICEGNYLLLEEAPWCDLLELFDHSLHVGCAEEALLTRLVRRHMATGLAEVEARVRAESNDLVNARLICGYAHRASQIVSSVDDDTAGR